MSNQLFENILGKHCSPVLMGMKPSNLVSVSKEKVPDVLEYAKYYTAQLKEEGIRIELVCSCKKHDLLLVYRPEMLKDYLADDKVRNLLKKDGYPEKGSLEEMISHLKERYAQKQEVPHEIGFFLGYPLEDVEGFQKYGGSECKMCGYWKVYGDVENAKILFAQFDRCRDFISNQLRAGYNICQVLGMKDKCVA